MLYLPKINTEHKISYSLKFHMNYRNRFCLKRVAQEANANSFGRDYRPGLKLL